MNYIDQKFNKKSQRTEFLIPLLNILSDSASIISAFIISYWIRFFFQPFVDLVPFNGEIPPLTGYVIFAIVVLPVWLLIFQSRKMFRPKRIVFIFDEFFLIGRLVTFGIIFSFGLIFFYRVFPYSRVVFVLVWIISIILITIGRYVVLKYEKTLYNKGKGLKDTILADNNQTALDIYDQFAEHKYAGFNIIGFVEENPGPSNGALPDKLKLGTYNEVVDLVQKLNI